MKRLFLIAGHQGVHTGASKYIDEGYETIKLRDALANELKTFEYDDILKDNNQDSLTDVIKWVNDQASKQDLLISLHFNASGCKASGTEVFVSKFCKDPSTIVLAKELASTIASTIHVPLRSFATGGVKPSNRSGHSTLGILDKTKCNSLLIEVCFCDNQFDSRQYKLYKNELLHKLIIPIQKYLNR
ncbi:N-acetylmuramoyl-L-alanine amidase [Gammaproteobacteria bacterium]|nr:N-acetylmuramoyl-L-alanine amidase [Gammaproteobacteria bacterium]